MYTTNDVTADAVIDNTKCTPKHDVTSVSYIQTHWEKLIRFGAVYDEATLEEIDSRSFRVSAIVNAPLRSLDLFVLNDRSRSTS